MTTTSCISKKDDDGYTSYAFLSLGAKKPVIINKEYDPSDYESYKAAHKKEVDEYGNLINIEDQATIFCTKEQFELPPKIISFKDLVEARNRMLHEYDHTYEFCSIFWGFAKELGFIK